MEDIFTIKVKTKPDTRNLYPSERRYSASTVSGLAWVHIALAATSFVLACLAIVHPIGGGAVTHLTPKDAVTSIVDRVEFLNNITSTDNNSDVETHEDIQFNATQDYAGQNTANEYSCILVIAPSLLTVASLAAGIASIMASSHWYVDRNITWLLLMSILSTAVSFIAFIMILTWIANTESSVSLSRFYKDKIPFEDYIVVPKSNIVDRNGSHIIVAHNSAPAEVKEHLITKRVLSINILIACFLEFIWSILSLKISYKGMKSNYKDEEIDRRGGNCVAVVTTIKGNMKSQRNGKVITAKPDLISHYPTNNKIKRFLSETNGFDNNDDEKEAKPANESSSEYRERMMNFLNRCASFDSASNPDVQTPSVQSDIVLSSIPEVKIDPSNNRSAQTSRVSTISWGDAHNHTVYNQNNLDLERILKSQIEHASVEADDKDASNEGETADKVGGAEISETKES